MAEALSRSTSVADFIRSMPRMQAWRLILEIALLKKRTTPQYRGIEPRGMGARAAARAEGYSNVAHQQRVLKEARDIVLHGTGAEALA